MAGPKPGVLRAAGDVPVVCCSPTAVRFEVPRPAISADMIVMTPEGIAAFDSMLEDCYGIPRG
jgi:hypothetical protein